MTGCKLVPIGPTPEWVANLKSVRIGRMESVIEDVLAAAPAVQGEAVAITDADILAIAGRVESCPVSPWWLKDDVAVGDVRAAVLRFARALLDAAPQPAEQQPDNRADVRMDKQRREDVAAALGFVRGGNYAWPYLIQQIKDITSAAESQQPAPDVTALVDALTDLCDEIDNHDIHSAISKTDILWFKHRARAALAAYRKQGGGV